MRLRDGWTLAGLLSLGCAGCLDIDSLHSGDLSAPRDGSSSAAVTDDPPDLGGPVACKTDPDCDGGCCNNWSGGSCFDRFSTVSMTVCLRQGVRHCGGAGEACCARHECDAGGCCYDGKCWANDHDLGSANAGVSCKNGSLHLTTDTTCGANKAACCVSANGNDRALYCTGSDVACQGSLCTGCGGNGQPCCPGNVCDGGCCVLALDYPSCVDPGQPCPGMNATCRPDGACGLPGPSTCGGAGDNPCQKGNFPFCTQPWLRPSPSKCTPCGGKDAAPCGAHDCRPGLRYEASKQQCVEVFP